MILWFFASQTQNICHLCCLFLCFKVVSGLKLTWLNQSLFLLPPLMMLEDWLVSRVLGCPLCPWSTWVSHWRLRLRQNQFGMALFKRWNVAWWVGSGCICLVVIGSQWLKSSLSNLPTYFFIHLPCPCWSYKPYWETSTWFLVGWSRWGV